MSSPWWRDSNQTASGKPGAVHLVGCSSFFEAGGHRVALSADVLFKTEAGAPHAEEIVYIVETIGTMHPITGILRTDAEGRIALRGSYCLPAIVAMRGGSITLHEETLKRLYLVTVKSDEEQSLQQIYGEPNPAFLEYSATHKDCG